LDYQVKKPPKNSVLTNLENFDLKVNKANLTPSDVQEINTRDRALIVCYIGGNEGGSLVSCLHNLHFLLYGVLKEYVEITELLKRVRVSIVLAANVE
jgi:hypothetical protein